MKVDMSAEAVTARLKLASQLRRLCLELGKARPVDFPLAQPFVSETPSTYELPQQTNDERVSVRPRR